MGRVMIDLRKLTSYLEEKVEGFNGPIEVQAFDQGQSNPTYRLDTPDTAYVLRKQPPGRLLKGAHAVDREFRVQRALWDTEVPVARVLHLCEDEGIVGTKFYLMDFADGRIFWDPALPELTTTERGQVYDEMNRVLAAIHDVDLARNGLSDFGRPSDYFARQLRRWSGQYDASGGGLPELEQLIGWLEENLPEDDGQVSLVHGDYRIDNLMFEKNSLRVKAVFDWELSTLGHPLADLAYQIMQRSMGRDWHLRGLAGLDIESLGIPSEQDYIAAYCRRRGLKRLENWPFSKAFAFFRFAAICHGVGARAKAGNAASPDAERVGAMAKPLTELGLAVTKNEAGGK